MENIITIFIALSLFLFDITLPSCIIHQTPDTCNAEPHCAWDTGLSSCICDSIIPQDIIIIMDSSPSLLPDDWIVAKQFVIDLISTAIPSQSSIAIIQFSTDTIIPYPLSANQNNRTSIIQTVSNLTQYLGYWTHMKDALSASINLFKNESKYPQKQIVLITDGDPRPTSQDPCPLRPQLDILGVRNMVIGVGPSWTIATVRCLVDSDNDIISVESFTPDSFHVTRNQTDEDLCSREFFVPPMNCSIILNINQDNTGIPSGDATWNKPNIDWARSYALYYQVKWYTFQNDEHNIQIRATAINQTFWILLNMEYRNPDVYNQQVRAIVDFGMGEIYYSIWDTCKLITPSPTLLPTISPTTTFSPSKSPTISPSKLPSISPTNKPTYNPTITPTISPIESPSISPTYFPTISPTKYPTISPTSPTLTPIFIPTILTINPTILPTQPPNINLPPIKWCIVLIKDENTYQIKFEIPQDTIKITHYIITYLGGENSIPTEEVNNEHLNGANNFTKLLFPKDVIITPNTPFYMTTMNRDFNQYYTNYTQCEVLTMSPTINPTLNPSNNPTISPTYQDVGIFVYSDERIKNKIICKHDERCACVVDKNNYECIGKDYPEGTQIEDTLLRFKPSNGVQEEILFIGRYPYYFTFDVEIEWEFIYLNDSNDFEYGKRIKPIKGINIIKKGTKLGDIVFAEFVAMPNEQRINEQWYMFKILNCKIYDNNIEEIDCYIIYPSWVYIIWTPPNADELIIIEGGEPFPDWIFYLLLGATVTGVAAAYGIFVFYKNRNLKNIADAQDDHEEAMLAGIAPGAHVVQ